MCKAVDRTADDLPVIDRAFAVASVASPSSHCGYPRVGEEDPVRRR
jgi:hypothetical protein